MSCPWTPTIGWGYQPLLGAGGLLLWRKPGGAAARAGQGAGQHRLRPWWRARLERHADVGAEAHGAQQLLAERERQRVPRAGTLWRIHAGRSTPVPPWLSWEGNGYPVCAGSG